MELNNFEGENDSICNVARTHRGERDKILATAYDHNPPQSASASASVHGLGCTIRPQYNARKHCFHGKLCGIPGCMFYHKRDKGPAHYEAFPSSCHSYPDVPRAGRILGIITRMATKQREYRTIRLSQSEVLSAHFGMCWLMFYTNRIAKLVSPGCSTPVLAFTLQSDVKHLHLILKNSELGTEALNVWEKDRDNGYARARDIYYRDSFSLDKIPIRYSMYKGT